mgnify:FL=1
MSIADILEQCLPDAKILRVVGVDVTISSTASPKAIFDAERELRARTVTKWELFMERGGDQNKLRIKLAKLRGIGNAT